MDALDVAGLWAHRVGSANGLIISGSSHYREDKTLKIFMWVAQMRRMFHLVGTHEDRRNG